MVILKKGMKATIESIEERGTYLIRVYGNDGILYDAYTVKKIYAYTIKKTYRLRKSTLKRYLKQKNR